MQQSMPLESPEARLIEGATQPASIMSARLTSTTTSLHGSLARALSLMPHLTRGLVANWVVLIWATALTGLVAFGFFFPSSHSVFPIYARAARGWWVNQDIYAAQPYRYSPLFAILLSPIAFLPDNFGSAIWRIIDYLIFVIGIVQWTRHALPVHWNRPRIQHLFLWIIPLSLQSLQNGQANLMMIGFILLAVTAATKEQWNSAAAWLAAATLIKVYPGALALLLSVLWFRQFSWRFVLALLAGLLAPFVTAKASYVWSQYQQWGAHLSDSTTGHLEGMRSVGQLFYVYASPLPGQVWLVLQALTGLGVFALCLRYARRFEPKTFQFVVFLFFSIWVVLFGPAIETCSYVVMAPAAAWAMVYAFSDSQSWSRRLVVLASFLTMGPFVTDLLGGRLRNFAEGHGSQPLGGAIFCVWVIFLLESMSGPGLSYQDSTADPILAR